jgi:DNA-binding HxlR family transcriptional regulator
VGKRQQAASTPRDEQPTGGRAGAPARGLTAVDGHAPDATPIDLDRLIHERIRLGIVSALAVNESLSFNALKSLMGTTDGNLSVHARKLEDAGYIRCTKSFEGRMPKTDFALTAAGRTALERYLGHMEAIIKSTREYER